jgi:hypothetical protein
VYVHLTGENFYPSPSLVIAKAASCAFFENGKAPACSFRSIGRDRDPMNPPVRVVLNDDQPVAKERAKVAGQRRPFEAKQARKPRRRHRGRLNERRKEVELQDPHAGAPHRLVVKARQSTTLWARRRARALAASGEVDRVGMHAMCIYAFIDRQPLHPSPSLSARRPRAGLGGATNAIEKQNTSLTDVRFRHI